uniref:Uncharacterized protein n=1 Tax=Schistosoma curassoni TaxID=6186 RepID=A0A183KYG8_9TREM
MKLVNLYLFFTVKKTQHNSCCMFDLLLIFFPDEKENIDILSSLLILFQFDGR